MHFRSWSSGLVALSLSVSLAWGCSTPAVTPPASVVPATTATPAPAAPIVTVPASATPVTLNGTAAFNGSPLAGYSIEVYDAKTGKPVDKKADLAGLTTLALLDKNLKVATDGKFSLQIVNLSAGQALRIVCRSESGKAKLETVVFGDRQALPYKVQQTNDVALELNELTTALSHSVRGVLTASLTLKPEAAAGVLSKLVSDLDALSAKLDGVLKGSSALAGELVRAETANEQANAMRSLIENAGALRLLTQLVVARVSEISAQAKEAGNQNPEATTPEIQVLLQHVEFLGTRIAGQLDNKAVELTYGDSRQPLDGSNLESFITKATTPTSGGSGGSAPTYSDLVKNLNNQDDDDSNDDARQSLEPDAIIDALDLLKANKAAFGSDWTKFEALTPDDLLPPLVTYRVLDAPPPPYTTRQRTVGKLMLERVFRHKPMGDNYRVLSDYPTPVPYQSIQQVQRAFHEAVELETHLKDLLAAIKPAIEPLPPSYRVLTLDNYTDEQQRVIDAFNLTLLGKLDADFAQLETWRIKQTQAYGAAPVTAIDGCQFAISGATVSLKATVQSWKTGFTPDAATRASSIITFFQNAIFGDPLYATLSDAGVIYGIFGPVYLP